MEHFSHFIEQQKAMYEEEEFQSGASLRFPIGAMSSNLDYQQPKVGACALKQPRLPPNIVNARIFISLFTTSSQYSVHESLQTSKD